MRAGPGQRFSVMAERVLSNDLNTKVVQTEVVNCGDRSTTITNIAMAYFETQWSWARLRNRPVRTYVLINPNIPGSNVSQPLPGELKPGGVWRGLTGQNAQLEMWARNGVLYFDPYHSHNVKPVRQRVTLKVDDRAGPPVRL